MVVLQTVKLVTIVAAGDPEADDLFAFGDALIASQWWQTFGAAYGLGTPSANVHVTGGAFPTTPNLTDVPSYVASAIQGVASAAPNGHTMYMVYAPPGVVITAAGSANTNCQLFQGYHDEYNGGADAWGVVQRCSTTLADTTTAASHEIAEGASDPIFYEGWILPMVSPQSVWTQPQSQWTLAFGGEIADLCPSTQYMEGSFSYQRIWSNAAAALGADPCVPAYPQYAYVNSSAPQAWYALSASGSVQIPMTGFSDRPAPDWWVSAEQQDSSGPNFDVYLTSPTSVTLDGGSYSTSNNGRPFTLTVTAQAGTTSGSSATIAVYSEPLTPNPADPFHSWIVGVYVP